MGAITPLRVYEVLSIISCSFKYIWADLFKSSRYFLTNVFLVFEKLTIET